MNDRLFNLMQFLGAYFHQDWALEAHSADEVLRRFVGQESKNVRLAIVTEISELLEASDQVVADTVQASGFCYDPSVEGMNIRQWLGGAKEVLQAE